MEQRIQELMEQLAIQESIEGHKNRGLVFTLEDLAFAKELIMVESEHLPTQKPRKETHSRGSKTATFAFKEECDADKME